MITRRSLFDENDLIDEQIAALNAQKSDNFAAYRDQMKEQSWAKEDISLEVASCKKAFRRMRALATDADAVLEQDALVDEIVAELQKPVGTVNATHAAPASRTRPTPSPSIATLSPKPGSDGEPAGCTALIPDGEVESARETDLHAGLKSTDCAPVVSGDPAPRPVSLGAGSTTPDVAAQAYESAVNFIASVAASFEGIPDFLKRDADNRLPESV